MFLYMCVAVCAWEKERGRDERGSHSCVHISVFAHVVRTIMMMMMMHLKFSMWRCNNRSAQQNSTKIFYRYSLVSSSDRICWHLKSLWARHTLNTRGDDLESMKYQIKDHIFAFQCDAISCLRFGSPATAAQLHTQKNNVSLKSKWQR